MLDDLRLLTRVRSVRWFLTVTVVVAVGFVIFRLVTTSGDLTEPLRVAWAHKQEFDRSNPGGETTVSQFLEDPRYFMATSGYADLANLTVLIVFALTALQSIMCGHESEIGFVRMDVLRSRSRTRPVVDRLIRAAVAGAGVAAAMIGLVGALLWLVPGRHGISAPFRAVDLVQASVRAGVLAGLGSVVGASLGLAFRRAVAPLALLLGYLVVGEGVLRSIRTVRPSLPSAQMFAWVAGPQSGRQVPCGLPDCPVGSVPSAWISACSIGAAVVAATLVGVAAWSARRDIRE